MDVDAAKKKDKINRGRCAIKMNTTKTTLEFLEKLEKYGKELGILNIGYLNDLKKHQIKLGVFG